ncbi:ATPase [Spirosoma daeguense]
MQSSTAYTTLLERIDEYKKRYFQNQLVKGSLFFLALLGSGYLLINTAEFVGRFDSVGRGMLFFGFLLTVFIGFYLLVARPLMSLYGLNRPLTNDEAARQIGTFFPEVGDKLLNTLQLQRISADQSDLLQASLNQRSQQLLINRFANAIQISRNRQFLKYAIPPLALILLILLVNPAFFTKSSTRIVNYDQEFVEEAPFQFIVQNKSMKAFRNEDFPLSVKLSGDAIPQAVYVVTNGTRFKLDQTGDKFTYNFDNLQRDLDFQLEAAGFKSPTYKVLLIDRPAVLSFNVRLEYPAYLNKPAEQLTNVGNLLVPQGTIANWEFAADHTDSLLFRFNTDAKPTPARLVDDNTFVLNRKVMQNAVYTVSLKNGQISSPSTIQYNVQVIPDRYPQISVDRIQDSITYNYIALSGLISDDYGFSKLKLNYKIIRNGKSSSLHTQDIPVNRSTTSQNFVYNWTLDSLKLGQEDRLEYYVQVWDNDGVNGPKSSQSNQLNFVIPSNAEIQEQVDKSAEKTEQQIDNALSKTHAIKKEINQMEERMRTKKSSDFQDKKQLQEVLQKREELLKEIQKLQEQFQKTNETQQRFADKNQAVQDKLDQLQKLFNELMDPESKQLYEQLKQMLERKQDDKASDLLNKLSRKERNLERDLDRALKLFKQMQLEQKVNNIAENLEKQAENLEKQAEENNKKNETSHEQQKQQEKSQEDFKKTQEQLKEVQKEAEKEDLNKPDSSEKEQEDIEKNMDEATKDMKSNKGKQASSKQQKSAKSMRAMSKSMKESMESAEMQEMQENMDDLRNILDNLITLSFGQERVMKDFRGMSLQDPRVTKLSQEQLKLQDDAKIIEDSLNALASRVVQIQSFVTRELTNMKSYMDESTQQLRERRLSMASSKQQFAMTSINNLALMLSDVLKNMQQQMNAMAMPGKGKGGKKGDNPGGMGEMQKQLNGKMQQLQKGGQSGRGLSEQLSQMAAEQAMIRQMLKKMEENAKGTEAGKQQEKQIKDLMEKMDESETDLVNKRVNQNLINRQNEILTRLLESEKALKQQEEDPKRQAETAKSMKRSTPSFFDSTNLQNKTKQVEVLRSVTPNYNLFYKKEANQYLQKVSK